ncbi:hypothetical protein D9611_009447 [Ephemerocybe angulata]|uniref:Fungal-type protein kinase domain-containing protein n=1 Tax=Ephemerocybe angulata TaxID=980116 RepID=A0A8H5AVA7_9AGAR|nr:hypothetical protein D9611_009447 [Tulosesus angulatus]
MEKSFSPDEVHTHVWDILRCVTLLWALGISHGDISLGNIMSTSPDEDGKKRVVLIDFDLAAVDQPGPLERSFERTNAKPFMAVELLSYAADEDEDEPVPHLLRHDIESIFWCLICYCREHRRWDWTLGTYQQVFEKKVACLFFTDPNKPDKYYIPPFQKYQSLWRATVLFLVQEDVIFRQECSVPPRVPRTVKDVLESCEALFPSPGGI